MSETREAFDLDRALALVVANAKAWELHQHYGEHSDAAFAQGRVNGACEVIRAELSTLRATLTRITEDRTVLHHAMQFVWDALDNNDYGLAWEKADEMHGRFGEPASQEPTP
jgi:hypothetical protein